MIFIDIFHTNFMIASSNHFHKIFQLSKTAILLNLPKSAIIVVLRNHGDRYNIQQYEQIIKFFYQNGCTVLAKVTYFTPVRWRNVRSAENIVVVCKNLQPNTKLLISKELVFLQAITWTRNWRQTTIDKGVYFLKELWSSWNHFQR